MKKRALTIFAILCLALALGYHYYAQHQENLALNEYYQQLLPGNVTTEELTGNSVRILDATGKTTGFAGLAKYNGFGGPMLVGIVTDPQGIMTRTQILEHKETPQYLERITKEGFFEQFDHYDIAKGTTFGVEIDGISGATFSTRAITMCTDQVAESIRTAGLGLPAHSATVPWQFGLAEVAIAVLIALCIVLANVRACRKLRPALLIASVVLMGFWLNRPQTIAQISGVFMGYFPVFKTNLIWYMILLIALLPPILVGKNYYCTYLCPFGAAEEGLGFIGKKTKLPSLPHGKAPFLRKTRNLIVFVVLLMAFLFQNPSVSSFEPFATLFQLKGTGLQILLLVSVLAAALFFNRFWCVGFCPVGGFLDFIATGRRALARKIKGNTAAAEAEEKPKETAGCPHQQDGKQALSKAERAAEGLYKFFYAIILFSVVVAIFEKWSLL